MNIQSAGYLSCHDRSDPTTAPYCRSRVGTCFCTQKEAVKPLAAQCKQHDRIYRCLIIRPLSLQRTKTHHSNPHSAAVASRGFLPRFPPLRLARRLPGETRRTLTGLQAGAGILQPLTEVDVPVHQSVLTLPAKSTRSSKFYFKFCCGYTISFRVFEISCFCSISRSW